MEVPGCFRTLQRYPPSYALLMSPKRPGIKQSNVTKLLRKGALAPTDHGEEQDEAPGPQHGWHASFDTQLSLSSVPSVQSVHHKASASTLSTASLKQAGPQLSIAEVVQWAAQFHHTCLAFCSGSKLLQYAEDVFGPGLIQHVCLPLACHSSERVLRTPDTALSTVPYNREGRTGQNPSKLVSTLELQRNMSRVANYWREDKVQN